MYSVDQIKHFIKCPKFPDKPYEIPSDDEGKSGHGDWVRQKYELKSEDHVFILVISHKLNHKKFNASLLLNNQPIIRFDIHDQHQNHKKELIRTREHIHIICPENDSLGDSLKFILFTNKFESKRASFYTFVRSYLNIQTYENDDSQTSLF